MRQHIGRDLKENKSYLRSQWRAVIGLCLVLAMAPGCLADESGASMEAPVISLEADPASRNDGSGLQPGLAVRYYGNIFVRHVDKLIAHAKSAKGRPGPPIAQLNHQFDRNVVFDSGSNRGVGLRLAGYLHFAEAGNYRLQALANDGIRILLGERLLLEDPGVHGDRLSPVGKVAVVRPGWYPLTIWYYQRKGTAALKLFWRVPGGDARAVVPAAALAHGIQPVQ